MQNPAIARPSKHARKTSPKPPNAFLIYRSNKIKELKAAGAATANYADQTALSKDIAVMWHAEPENVKALYGWLRDQRHEEYRESHPHHTYTPSHIIQLRNEEKRFRKRTTNPKRGRAVAATDSCLPPLPSQTAPQSPPMVGLHPTSASLPISAPSPSNPPYSIDYAFLTGEYWIPVQHDTNPLDFDVFPSQSLAFPLLDADYGSAWQTASPECAPQSSSPMVDTPGGGGSAECAALSGYPSLPDPHQPLLGPYPGSAEWYEAEFTRVSDNLEYDALAEDFSCGYRAGDL
ncbi:hypothetical protein PLICRDRAFT_36827 [Plicaturopsis crispa FD-325 SS-3]|nr:hypothetical protein PLICRDRAFT_36827 [Plicaturopsis crispa FD-325 SS-3]